MAFFVLLAGLASACGSGERGRIQVVEGFAGLVAGDEPRAVAIGRDVIGSGGTAADAAVAMYFTMAVTMPSRAALGGGGACTAFSAGDSRRDKSAFGESYVFAPGVNAEGALAPINARAMGALHARHGAQRWEQLVSPAEKLARFGHSVSRAFARDIAVAKNYLQGDLALLQSLSNRDGELASEGDIIIQDELSSVLSGIRSQGAGYMYQGQFAARLAKAYQEIEVPMTKGVLWRVLPELGDALTLRIGKDIAYFPSPPEQGGIMTAQLWQMLTAVKSYSAQEGADRAHLFAEANLAVFADRDARAVRPRVDLGPIVAPTDEVLLEGTIEGDDDAVEDESSEEGEVVEMTLLDVAQNDISEENVTLLLADYLPAQHGDPNGFPVPPRQTASNPYVASFVTADQWGDAVACSFTMNGLFGSGRLAPETGVLVAGPLRPGAVLLTPTIVGNKNTGDLRFAGAASGGLAAPLALSQVMVDSLDGGEDLKTAMASPRVIHVGAPDVTWYESALSQDIQETLAARGHHLQEAPNIGEVVALICPKGILDDDESCEVAVDPRGFGLADRVE